MFSTFFSIAFKRLIISSCGVMVATIAFCFCVGKAFSLFNFGSLLERESWPVEKQIDFPLPLPAAILVAH